ncbi:MAG: CerR family C-terminal domain-containing protein [Rhizobiales bacterium]|nr:CerR family C-terminal domain-containing protein [Hyphomicrobiales bacterium]
MTDDARVHLRPRGRRDDGAATRLQILEVAGEVFAEKGFDRATGKEITERAGANSAAVNYYYHGIDRLYGEVLVEAHRRLVAYDVLAAITKGEGRPEDKLRRLLGVVVKAIMGPKGSSWALRVLSREILAPSAMFEVLRERELLPKKQLMTELISEMLGLPPDHPAVARACISIAAPFLMLLIGDRVVVSRMFPGIDRDERAVDDMVEHLIRFSLGGIAALAAAQPKP